MKQSVIRNSHKTEHIRKDDYSIMNHEMKLNPAPYSAIKTGKKTIEFRLNDEKRQRISVGDTITFSNTAIPELKLYTKVTALHHAESFEKLFSTVPFSACGFDSMMTIQEAVTAMRTYYSEAKEMEYGALGIEIELTDQDDDWTKHCDKIDVPTFLEKIDLMKCGESSVCPFCGGNVRMTANEADHTVFACDSCDMSIELENN